jgi:hypothetical protein
MIKKTSAHLVNKKEKAEIIEQHFNNIKVIVPKGVNTKILKYSIMVLLHDLGKHSDDFTKYLKGKKIYDKKASCSLSK